jgi:SAM-dependent methyltransferase
MIYYQYKYISYIEIIDRRVFNTAENIMFISRISGSDISKKMIDFAKDTHANEKRLSFIELNIEVDELPSNLINAFDNAVSFYCLHWCQNTR